MKCLKCGRTPGDHGVTLLRQNPKGEKGIYACESCNELDVPEDLAQAIAAIQSNDNPTLQ